MNRNLSIRNCTRMSNLIFSRLEGDARSVAEQFQRLVVSNYRSRRAEWPGVHALILDLAGSIGRLTQTGTGAIDPIAIAQSLHISVRFFESRVPRLCGALLPLAGGFESAVYRKGPNVDPLSTEERFTVAHECGHALFYYAEGGTPKRIIPRSPGARNRLEATVPLEEDLCDSFARALLVPVAHARDIASKTTSMTELKAAAADLGVGLDVLIRRIAHDLREWPEAVVYHLHFAESGVQVIVISEDVREGPSHLPSAEAVAHVVGEEGIESALPKLRRQFELTEGCVVTNGSNIWFRM